MRYMPFLLLLSLSVSACGKKGPLIYPEMLVPEAPAQLVLQQSGRSLRLSFDLPSRDRAGRKLSNLAGVSILKRDSPAGEQSACSSCTNDYSRFRKLNLDLLPADTQRSGNSLALLDGDVVPGRNYAYIVSVFTGDGNVSLLSPPVSAVTVVPPVPPVLQAASQPTEINLEFAGLPQQEGVMAGYNLYRTQKGESFPCWPLNGEPLNSNRYTDTGLERNMTYVYAARTVVRQASGALVESGLSNEVEGRLKDDE